MVLIQFLGIWTPIQALPDQRTVQWMVAMKPSSYFGGGSFKWTSCCWIPMMVCHPARRAGAFWATPTCTLRNSQSHWSWMCLRFLFQPLGSNHLMIEAKFRTMWFRCDWTLLMKCLLAQDLRKNLGKLRVLKDVSANSFSLALCSVREKDQKPLCAAQQSISMAGIDAHMSSHMPWYVQILYILLVGTKFLCSLQQHGHVNSSNRETARSPTYQQIATAAMKCKHLRFVLAGELKPKPTSMPF